MQCVIVKQAVRCMNLSDTTPGLTIPIIRSDGLVFMCVVCIDEMQFVVHQQEPGMAAIQNQNQNQPTTGVSNNGMEILK